MVGVESKLLPFTCTFPVVDAGCAPTNTSNNSSNGQQQPQQQQQQQQQHCEEDSPGHKKMRSQDHNPSGVLIQDMDVFHRNFELLEKPVQGVSGALYGSHRRTGQRVAVKTLELAQDRNVGVPVRALREISLLKSCSHPNVLRLRHVAISNACVRLVFDLMDIDLKTYMFCHGPLAHQALRNAVQQIFRGVDHCHRRSIVHRDLKPTSVLVDLRAMRLVIANFGLARMVPVQPAINTDEVGTFWYRAPEILLGAQRFGTPIDIWSLGCIVAELVTNQPLFPGDSEIATLFRIFRKLGTPTEETWPGVTTLEHFKEGFPKWKDTGLADVHCKAEHSGFGGDGLDLLKWCLTYTATMRPTARKALRHGFFDGVRASKKVEWRRDHFGHQLVPC